MILLLVPLENSSARDAVGNNIEKRINFFIKNEFLKLRKSLKKSKYKSNGADQVANYIIKNL